FSTTCIEGSNEFPLLTKRSEQKGARARDCTQRREIILLTGIGNMKCAILANPAKLWRVNTDRDAARGYGDGTKMSPPNQTVPLAESQHHVINPTNPGRALDNGIEDRLYIRGRAADDAEDFGRCRLVL